MKLNDKTLVFFGAITALLVVVLTVLSAYSFRSFSLFMAERHARSVAETVKVGLTESMINGIIGKRQQFLARLADVPGVQAVRVVRGPAVVKQFGAGLAQETGADASVETVFGSGREAFEVRDTDRGPIFHAVIPYVATDHGMPNCLQCHTVANDTVLGAVTIDISLTEVRQQGIIAVILVSVSVLGAALLGLLFLRRMLKPLSETAEAVKGVTTLAVGGDFGKRITQRSSDEVGEIAGNINRLMDFLECEVGTIRDRVGQLMGQHAADGGNQLVHTAEMVEGLVEAFQFKQAIEEDQNKIEIYQRLAEVLEKKYDYRHYSLYEVASSKNHMTPIIVDGEVGGGCRWCDQQVLVDATACRARRTGREVNGVDMPGICTMFRPTAGENHICLPINQSGTAGAIVQIVVSPEEAPLAKCMVPFVAVYLREAGPVIEAKRLMEHLRENSMRDAMTGLYNRRFLEEYVTQLVSGSQRRKAPFSVLMLDLDYFKQVNDTHGHEAGDKVIKALAEILVRNVRASDMAVRYGGEEFLMVLMDTGAEAGMQVAEKIRGEVEATKVALPGMVLQKTISIGVSEFPGDSETFWQVVKFADVALYQAKTQGRNRVVRFAREMWNEDGHY
ncbi:MAG: GGDEF domain-containing protein [Sulfurisoma sp.]|nr:GGDEF domain-containing protein [Sulfurisoma sp.]